MDRMLEEEFIKTFGEDGMEIDCSCYYHGSPVFDFTFRVRSIVEIDMRHFSINGDIVEIDDETDIKIADIVSIAYHRFMGCEMLCLEIKNPQDYKLSWRFRADKLFHKKYDAFVCPGLVASDQRQAFMEWFESRFPKSEKAG